MPNTETVRDALALPDRDAAGPEAFSRSAADLESEYVLVGGGLQNCLIALAVLSERPAARLTLIERGERLGGNHTWCFHEGSAPASARSWLEPVIACRWPAHDVRFQAYGRRISEEYCAITSESLHRAVSGVMARSAHARCITASATSISAQSVTLEDGREVRGELIVDARGPEHSDLPREGLGYQKFVGLELSVPAGSAPRVPMLMDATVEQVDGFRFMYVLPFAADRMLVEDTYYSERPELDAELSRRRIHAYVAEMGIDVRAELREEHGVLPIPTSFTASAPRNGPVRAGYAGGLFHPTTGYSFPVALRFALHVARVPASRALGAELAELLSEHRRQARYCVGLNRLLFRAFAEADRHRVLERFYRLPAPTIRRFYALEMTLADRLRIVCGRPPTGFSFSRLLAGETP